MNVQLIDDKKVTDFVSLALKEIIDNADLSEQFCEIIQKRNLYIHSLDTARYAVQIGIVLGGIDMVELAKAGLLHDIGKLDIPVGILDKPDKLNAFEREVMNTHPSKGYVRLSKSGVEDRIKEAALHHHEKLTGDGYPDQITDISLYAQILTVADIFSALTETRVYKKQKTSKESIKILRDMAGVNQGYVSILESKILIDELEDYRIRQLAKYYLENMSKYGMLEAPQGELEYSIGNLGYRWAHRRA